MDPNRVSWNPRPTQLDQVTPHQLLRVNGTAPLTAIILSRSIVGVDVHFWRGRTTPHLAGECSACADKNPFRWRGYLCVADNKGERTAALEITPPCVDAFDLYQKAWGQIRGAVIRLSRPSGKPNGRITCDLSPGKIPTERLPEEFDLQRLLFKLWEVQHHTAQPPTRTVTLFAQQEKTA